MCYDIRFFLLKNASLLNILIALIQLQIENQTEFKLAANLMLQKKTTPAFQNKLKRFSATQRSNRNCQNSALEAEKIAV